MQRSSRRRLTHVLWERLSKVERVEKKKGREEKKEKGKEVARREKVRDDENGARQLAC